MPPAQQRLGPHDRTVVQIDHRLVPHLELVPDDGRGEVGGELHELDRAGLGRVVEQLGLGRAPRLGPHQRRVGVAQHVLGRIVGGAVGGDADARRGEQPLARHRERRRHCVVDTRGDAQDVARLGEVRQHHRALVAAERRQRDVGSTWPSRAWFDPMRATRSPSRSAPRDPAQRLAQQQIARVVAELLVERAKSIEVDEHQREPRRRIAPRRLHQRRDVRAQGVEARQPGEGIARVASVTSRGCRRAASGGRPRRARPRRPRSPSGTRRCRVRTRCSHANRGCRR